MWSSFDVLLGIWVEVAKFRLADTNFLAVFRSWTHSTRKQVVHRAMKLTWGWSFFDLWLDDGWLFVGITENTFCSLFYLGIHPVGSQSLKGVSSLSTLFLGLRVKSFPNTEPLRLSWKITGCLDMQLVLHPVSLRILRFRQNFGFLRCHKLHVRHMISISQSLSENLGRGILV
jgi:hypothetical protein